MLEKRQKLVGLVKGKLPADTESLGDLNLGVEKSFIMMGTPEKDIMRDPQEGDGPDVPFFRSITPQGFLDVCVEGGDLIAGLLWC